MARFHPHLLTLVTLAGAWALGAAEPTTGIRRDVWTEVGGSDVSNLIDGSEFPNNPNESEILAQFETPTNWGENYGQALRGYVLPPVNGPYTFWIASDDSSELWLSSSEDAKDVKKIAQVQGWTEPRAWTANPSQKSAPIQLEAGKRYYIEARHKEGGGGDHLSVGWTLPDGNHERPIPGARLAPAPAAKKTPSAANTPTTVKLIGGTPATFGQHKLRAEITIGGKTINMAYLLCLPKAYESGQPQPLLIFLHGNTHQGTDHEGLLNEGPALEWNRIPKLRDEMPLIIMIPQALPGKRWDTPQMNKATIALLDEVVKNFRVDPKRLYCTGLSMGGLGTWRTALEAPDRFAALAPLCGVAVQPAKAAELLKNVPTWIIVGSNDGGFTAGSKEMKAAFDAAGGKAELTVVPNEGHGVWARYYPDINFYKWFLKHSK